MTRSLPSSSDLIGCEMCENGEQCIHCIGAERDRYREELREAHHWLKAAGMCDCEYFEGAGTKLCRFGEALDG